MASSPALTPCEGGREPEASGGFGSCFLFNARCTFCNRQRFTKMPPARLFFRYRRDLKSRARTLRHDPTPAERKLWFKFLSTRPEKFTRQKPLGFYIADFYCARMRLVIELDGDSHFTRWGERYDQNRTESLALYGIRIIRFSNAEVLQQFEAVCARIEEALAGSRK
jgi:very-short-patch-repair endonuclease